jgi:hypothetical protein
MTARTYTLLGPDRQPHQSSTSGVLGGYWPGRAYDRLDCPAELRAIVRGKIRSVKRHHTTSRLKCGRDT